MEVWGGRDRVIEVKGDGDRVMETTLWSYGVA